MITKRPNTADLKACKPGDIVELSDGCLYAKCQHRIYPWIQLKGCIRHLCPDLQTAQLARHKIVALTHYRSPYDR